MASNQVENLKRLADAQPDLRPIGGGRYILAHTFSHRWQVGGLEYAVVVPRWTVSDGVSVPRIFWTLTGILPDGVCRAAALVHDVIYSYRGRLPTGMLQRRTVGTRAWTPLAGVQVTRANADRLLGRMMREAGYGKIRRRLVVAAVRAFGWIAWRE